MAESIEPRGSSPCAAAFLVTGVNTLLAHMCPDTFSNPADDAVVPSPLPPFSLGASLPMYPDSSLGGTSSRL